MTAVHNAPLLVEKYVPWLPPRKILVPITAKPVTIIGEGKPLFATVQLAPLFVDTYAPKEVVPATRFVPTLASAVTVENVPVGKPLFAELQFEPLFVDT